MLGTQMMLYLPVCMGSALAGHEWWPLGKVAGPFLEFGCANAHASSLLTGLAILVLHSQAGPFRPLPGLQCLLCTCLPLSLCSRRSAGKAVLGCLGGHPCASRWSPSLRDLFLCQGCFLCV